MATPSRRSGAVSSTKTVTPPSGLADNDILILACYIENATAVTFTPPAGFAAIPNTNIVNGAVNTIVYWKRASSESGNYTWSCSPAGASPLTRISAVQLCDTTDSPIESSSGTYNAAASSLTLPSITLLTNESLLMAEVNSFNFEAGVSSTAMTERVEDQGGATFDTTGSAGASGTKLISWTASSNVNGAIFSLGPVSGGATHEDAFTLNQLRNLIASGQLTQETNINLNSVRAITSSGQLALEGFIDLARSEGFIVVSAVGIISGSTTWGHVTGVTEDNIRTFVDHWVGDGTIGGTGDAEKVCLDSGESMVSEVVETGATGITLLYDAYGTGTFAGTLIMQYRHGSTQANCEAAGWQNYTVPFVSDGFVQVRIEAP